MKIKILAPLMIIVGFGLGLFYAWQLSPVKFTDASPAQVVTDYRQAWVIMAAEAYAQDNDWPRTEARLNSLRDPNIVQTITHLFDRSNAPGPNPIARALAVLADRYNVRTAAMLVYLSTPIVSTPTPTLTPRPTARPAVPPTLAPTLIPIVPTPAPTLIPTYAVIDKVSVCHPLSRKPQIQVTLQDENGFGLPGKEIWIGWDAGADRFVTGLKPEIDPGYGDFDMAFDQTYRVAIDRPASIVVDGLRADECATGRTTWQLTLRPLAP